MTDIKGDIETFTRCEELTKEIKRLHQQQAQSHAAATGVPATRHREEADPVDQALQEEICDLKTELLRANTELNEA